MRFRALALRAQRRMADNITADNSLHFCWSYKHLTMSRGEVSRTAVVPANKPVSNWRQCCGAIHTHNSKRSDQITRMRLSTQSLRMKVCSMTAKHRDVYDSLSRFLFGYFHVGMSLNPKKNVGHAKFRLSSTTQTVWTLYLTYDNMNNKR